MARPTRSGGGSSSGEEDGDAEWKAAIQSIAATTTATFTANGSNSSTVTTQTTRNNLVSNPTPDTDDYVDKSDEINQRKQPQKLKNYQLKAQKLLDNMLEKHLVIVKDACNVPDDDSVVNESGVRLFKNSTPGIVFDHVDSEFSEWEKMAAYLDEIQGPQKKPKLLPRRGIDENTKEFRRQLLSIAVDGKDILAAARYASQRSLARLEAKEATAKEKAKREEARIAELKRIRGERWLPSMAREMQLSKRSGQQV
ncbi:Ribose-5-phosphate isomerase A [Gossypium arboreum]|uniref:Ribose-5-phosphate isomerase A n=1 Tax=Gossypium arboreum TaxID=29729 RepID=A0A0B0NVQ3_GOSAR|nr:Ribose-5-phosphate isomerase A [Gossypium arboreum]